MPRRDKEKYNGRQKRQAEHLEEGGEKHGLSGDEAERRGDKSGAGPKKSPDR